MLRWRYHIEAHRADSHSYEHGEQWSGDYELSTQCSREAVVDFAVHYLVRPRQRGEPFYRITVFSGEQAIAIGAEDPGKCEWLTTGHDPWDATTPEEAAFVRAQTDARADLASIHAEILRQLQARTVVAGLQGKGPA